MSQIIGSGSTAVLIQQDDKRLYRIQDQIHLCGPWAATLLRQPFQYRNQFWPGVRNSFVGDQDASVGVLNFGFWEHPEITRGCASRYGVSGVTRDQYGSLLTGVTLKMYRTSTDELVSTVISDVNNGTYLLTTPYYPDQHYIVAYLVGSPDVQGTTVNTIIAA